jgi:hypothetical protein
MKDVDAVSEMFDEFVSARAQGERPDVSAYLDRAGEDREQLGRLIDAYLRAAPVRPPDAETLALMRERVAEPALLVLRRKLGLKREAVVQALLTGLGLPVRAKARVARRYHDLESDLLDAERVDTKVWTVLREVFGRDVRSLSVPAARYETLPAFHRAMDVAAPAPPTPEQGPPEARDDDDAEVDRLFGISD